MPFIPAAAWPRTVQRYANLPALANVTRTVEVFPGASTTVLRPAILKSCFSVPLFVTRKTTTPLFTALLESVNLSSLGFPAVTRTVCAVAA